MRNTLNIQIDSKSGRHFYARKAMTGGDATYIFPRKRERDNFLQRHENAEVISATEVYKILHDQHLDDTVLTVNRQKRIVPLIEPKVNEDQVQS